MSSLQTNCQSFIFSKEYIPCWNENIQSLPSWPKSMVNEQAKFRLASRRYFNTHGFCSVHEFLMFNNGLQYCYQLCDFRFLLWCKRDLRSSGILHSVGGNSILATTYSYENTTLCCIKFQKSTVLIYEGCSESNAPHFFSRKLFNQNVWNSCTI